MIRQFARAFIMSLVCRLIPISGMLMLQPAAMAAQLPAEEIEVTNVTLKNLRADLYAAEDRMHKIFNKLVDEEFKIICDEVAITGSLIKHRVCEPNFRKRAKIKDFRDAADGGVDRMRFTRTPEELDRDLKEKSERMKQLMAELALENPGLLAALSEVLTLRNEIVSRGGEP